LIFLEAWKTPLNSYKTQKVYDLTLTQDSPTQFKRQKTLSKTPSLINLVNYDINDNDEVVTDIKTLTQSTPIVLFSGFLKDYEELIAVFNYLVLLLSLLLLLLFI